MRWTIIVAGMILAFSTSMTWSHAEQPKDKAQATFSVHCYDVGGSALEGLPGVISVEKGWLNFKEINHVVYDPAKISVQQMENRLKKSGTYLGTVTEHFPGKK